MKRTLSFILTVIMIFSALPVSVLAEEVAELTEQKKITETEVDESIIGLEVSLGNSVYYIEEGNLLLSVDSSRPKTIDENVSWVVEDGGNVYYSKIEEYTTYIYKVDNTEFAKIFCPIDCFDVDGKYVYYSYFNDVFKYDTEEHTEEIITAAKISKFFLGENNEILSITRTSTNTFDDIGLLSLKGKTGKDFTENTSLANKLTKIFNLLPYSSYPYFTTYGNKSCCDWNTNNCSECKVYNVCVKHPELKNAGIYCSYDATTCYGFAKYVYYYIFGSNPNGLLSNPYMKNGNTYTRKETDLTVVEQLSWNKSDYTTLEKFMKKGKTGDILQTTTHTMIFLNSDDEGVSVLQCNQMEHDLVTIDKMSWEYLSKRKWSGKWVMYRSPNYDELYPSCTTCVNIGTKGFANFDVVGKGKEIHAQCKSCDQDYSNDTGLDTSMAGTWKRKSWSYINLYFRYAPYDRSNPNTFIEKRQYDSLEIKGLVTCADGGKWYKVDIGGQTGYIVAYKVNADFEQSGVTFVGGSEGIKLPSEKVTSGKSVPLRGLFKSNKNGVNITNVYGYIMKSDNTVVQSIEATNNSSTYEITQKSTINQNLKFNKLSDGVYYIKYVVKTSDNTTYSFYSYDYPNSDGYKGFFTVGTAPRISVENIVSGKKLTFTSTSGDKIYYTINNEKEKNVTSGGSIELTKAGDYSIKARTNSGNNTTISINIPKAIKPTIWDYIKNAIGLSGVDIDVNYSDKCAYVTIAGEGNVYYTTDGSEPNQYSKKYTEPFPITESTTVKAISIQSGCAPSDIETKEIVVREPEAPTITLYNTKSKIAQGKTATVSWGSVKYATSYTASLYLNGECIDTYETTGNTASFNLSKKSDTENFEYTIIVVAENFVGSSANSNAVTVTAMHPVTVTFVDRITRTSELTEEKLTEIKRRIDNHDGEGKGANLEGQVISIQKVNYDTLPSKPAVPSKKGFDFAGWSAELFSPVLTDTTVYADYEIKYYTVKFYDMDNNFERSEQPLTDNKYMYTDVATPPVNHTPQSGYGLTGWSVDVANSDGTDYNYVDGDIIVDIVCKWENMDLPALLEITDVIRDDNSYRVNIRLKNNNEQETQARVVVALYTSEGRHVYSQISEQDLDLGDYIEWGTLDTITLLYTRKASYVKAYLVAVNDDKTGGALSKEAVCENIVLDESSNLFQENSDWGSWSEWQETEIQPEENMVMVESKTQYRYKDKQYTTTNNSKTLSGWTYYHTDSSTGSWIYNGTNWVGAEDSEWRKREVSSTWVTPTYKTQYRYGRWTNGSNSTFCPEFGYSSYGGSWWIENTAWSDTQNFYWNWNSSKGRAWHSYCSGSGHRHWYVSEWISGVPYWNQRYVNGYSGKYFWEETQQVQTGGGYTTYSYRDTYYTHYFWKWGGWSSWSDSAPSTSSNRTIETRTLWRSCKKVSNYESNTDPEDESIDNYPTIKGVLDCGETEYITEDEYNSGNYTLISGPYYKNDDGEYVDIETDNVNECRYGRYTNGTYVMPCKEAAEEIYGGDWELEYTDWSEFQTDEINESVYLCENISHTHADAIQTGGVNYWNEYIVNGKSYCYNESREVTKDVTYTDTNKYYLVNKNLEGKVATVLVYKKTNTDPTQGQLQYANQIEIGSGNTYEININTKEIIEYGKTGDFVVSIALEGCQRLLTVDVIEAEPPRYEVYFTVNGEEYVPDCNKEFKTAFTDDDGNLLYIDDAGNTLAINAVSIAEGDSIDVNLIGIPEIEGYRFVKWDKSLVNINGRLDVNAVLEKEDYAVVFVDHENETVELQELYYGDPISAPDVLPVDGKVFKGWDNQSYRYVLEEQTTNGNYTIVDGPYYKITDDMFILVSDFTDETIVDGTKYYRVATNDVPIVTGNTVITAVWESLIYTVTFYDLDGNVVEEQQVEYGEAATPPACIVVDGNIMPWNTNDNTWWNVTKDMTIYPYKYIPSDVVAPISDVASGTYTNGQIVYLEAQGDSTIYYTTDVEISQEDAYKYLSNLENAEIELVDEEYISSIEDDDNITLLSNDEESSEEETFVSENIDVTEFIKEYTEPIVVEESSIVYAFTIKDGEVSPISVYYYEIDSDSGSSNYEISSDVAQITLPSIVAKPGETVTVPVTIKNNPGVSNLSLVFAYDAENLTLISAENGDVFKKSEFSSDTRTDGSCKFTWLSASENTTDGTLLTMKFKVGEAGGDYSIDMSIDEAVTSEEEMPFATQSGNIENIGLDAYLGDTNGDGSVSFADAIILLRYDIGFATLTDYQLSISDVNGDGDVDFADAIKILRFDAGLITTLK